MMIRFIASILVFASALATASASALTCDTGEFSLFTLPAGATTNGTLQAKDVPGALDWNNSSKRFTGGVCAATYGLREAQIMRKIFPLAIGSLAQWDRLQNSMPDLTAFDLCPTNVPSDAEYKDPAYRFMVTAGGERAISYESASKGSIWNGLGGDFSSTNHFVKTGAWDLATPPESNRVFRTPRLTAYLKKVIDMPIVALLRSEYWRMGSNYSPDSGYWCWLDPTVDHASLATGTWCTDSADGIVLDYAAFLRSLAEYRKDVDATNMMAKCTMFGADDAWGWAIPWYEADFVNYGFPRATTRFKEAKAERESGKITDMIAKSAPGLRAAITSDWQKAVQKIAASDTTRLWWQRQALANGIVALQSRFFMPLNGSFSGFRPKDVISDSTLMGGRLSNLVGKERYISGTTGKTEYYELPSGSVTPYWGWFDDKRQAGLMARIDASKLNVTNTVINDNTTIGENVVYGGIHEAHWENTGCLVSIMLTPSREICGEDDRKTCLPNAGDDGGGGSGPNAIVFDELSPGETKEYDMGNFELVCEPTTVVNPDGGTARKWVFRVYTAQTLPSGVANKLVQEFNVPIDGKWRGGGVASYSANVDGRSYASSDAPGAWLPLPQEKIPDDRTSEPLGLVTEGSRLAQMMTADVLVLEMARAGTNAYSEAWNFIDYGETNDLKNAWIYTRLYAPYRNVVPTTGALKDVEHLMDGAEPVRGRMTQVIDMLPSSDADTDPFTIEKAKAVNMGSLKPTVEELFPEDRGLPGPREARIPWKDASAWRYVLKRSEAGAYSAEWKVQNEMAVLVEISCGDSENRARPNRNSVWVEYGANAAMILKFDFPMMNSNSEFKESQ